LSANEEDEFLDNILEKLNNNINQNHHVPIKIKIDKDDFARFFALMPIAYIEYYN